MKRITLLAFALVFMAGTALAQNTSTTTQTGDDNSATVTQSYTAKVGYGTNEATIAQVGNSHSASFTQRFAGGSGTFNQSGFDHTASAEVTGYGTSILVDQSGGDAGASTGGANVLDLVFSGDDSSIDTYQAGDGSKISFRGEGWSHSSAIDLDQVGNDNEARIKLSNADGTQLSLTQDGDGNRFGQWGGPPSGILISGDGNSLDALQLGDDNWAEVSQTGGGNSATIEQSGTTASTLRLLMTVGSSSVGTLLQSGGGGHTVAGISGVTTDVDTAELLNGSSLALSQTGAGQMLYLFGDGATVDVTQSGATNIGTIESTSGTATLTQAGTSNTATIVQQ